MNSLRLFLFHPWRARRNRLRFSSRKAVPIIRSPDYLTTHYHLIGFYYLSPSAKPMGIYDYSFHPYLKKYIIHPIDVRWATDHTVAKIERVWKCQNFQVREIRYGKLCGHEGRGCLCVQLMWFGAHGVQDLYLWLRRDELQCAPAVLRKSYGKEIASTCSWSSSPGPGS